MCKKRSEKRIKGKKCHLVSPYYMPVTDLEHFPKTLSSHTKLEADTVIINGYRVRAQRDENICPRSHSYCLVGVGIGIVSPAAMQMLL